MIAHLKGNIIHKDEKYFILDVQGIGYKVFATFETIESNPLLAEVGFWIHHVIREDASDLYGFGTKEELDFFGLLISVSGIGPKTALGIINAASVGAIKKAVTSGDTSHLVKVSGVGKKNAEKIVLELKGKFEKDDTGSTFKEEVDALEALKSLGFSHNDARDALKNIDSSITKTGDKIKAALKILGR